MKAAGLPRVAGSDVDARTYAFASRSDLREPRRHAFALCRHRGFGKTLGCAEVQAVRYVLIVMRSGLSRLVAGIAALLLSLTSSGMAATHALVHAQVASDHASALPFAQPTVEDGDHSHAHPHVAVDTAPASRDGAKFDASHAAIPARALMLTQHVVLAVTLVRSPALLPRPGPHRGPPSGPRAPPTV